MGATGYSISSSGYESGNSRWSCGGTIQGFAGLNASSFSVGDIIFDNSTSYGTRRWRIVEIHSSSSGSTFNCWVIHEGPKNISNASLEKPNTGSGNGAICNVSTGKICDNPSIVIGSINESLHAEIANINNKFAIGPSIGKNTYIQGRSGFSSHELDGSNDNLNSYIEWNSTDQTHYHRVEPEQNGQDLHIKVGFQFPSYFEGLTENGTALEFYALADNGSGNGSNYCELASLIDTDGTEYNVSGKQITSTTRTTLSLTKSEIDSILNLTQSSSSSSQTRTWDSSDAGKIVYARFKLYGDNGDQIYLDADNNFLYIK